MRERPDPVNSTATATSEREGIRRAAVALLNSGGFAAATVAEICAAAGVDEPTFERHFSSLNEVYIDIAESLVAAHVENMGATMLRRRSLTESMRLMLLAFWGLVEERLDDHRALKYLTFAGLAGEVHGGDGDTSSLYATFLDQTEAQLLEVERIHSITWELPVRQLARMMLATLDGLVLDYLVNRDSAGARQMLEIFAYHLAQHGRRVAKNYPH
jgi:AcrR family transcriptional regulator